MCSLPQFTSVLSVASIVELGYKYQHSLTCGARENHIRVGPIKIISINTNKCLVDSP